MSATVVQRIEWYPGLFTKELAAVYLSMSTREIDLLRNDGTLIPVGSGKRVKFTKEELDRYIAQLPERSAS
ncbi:helix-turn-helix domain-containing protein [Microbacterium sp. NPDC089698]|uniref:helix-turn-helix domain-containing protein n=1 Tax=Microbacterium sp. NPDC089698 TaxID=3364200 RepID=UPI00382CB715